MAYARGRGVTELSYYARLHSSFSDDRAGLLDEEEMKELKSWYQRWKELTRAHHAAKQLLSEKQDHASRVSAVITAAVNALYASLFIFVPPFRGSTISFLLFPCFVWGIAHALGLAAAVIGLWLRFSTPEGKEVGDAEARVRQLKQDVEPWVRSLELDKRSKPARDSRSGGDDSAGHRYWATGGVYAPQEYYEFRSGRSQSHAEILIDRYGDVETYNSNS